MAYEGYDSPYLPDGRYRFDRGFEQAYHLRYDRDYRGGGGGAPWWRMGMHDMTEHFGRYSGGPPDAYEYSERIIEHRHPYSHEGIGFTRPLSAGRRRPASRYGREYGAAPERGSARGRRYGGRERRPPGAARERRRRRPERER